MIREQFKSVPPQPGIYAFLNKQQEVIYVGKSKNLKRRMNQYKNSKRIKKQIKMHTILIESVSVQFEICQNVLQAEILETRLIQRLKPKWNIAAAFYFLYPFIGVQQTPDQITLAYTTQPEILGPLSFQGEFYGCYRSRTRTRDAYFALHALFQYLAHPEQNNAAKPKYSLLNTFRKRPSLWPKAFELQLALFLTGESHLFLETLALALLEIPDACRRSGEVQTHLKILKNFYRREAQRLFRMRKKLGIAQALIPQIDRDILFLEYKAQYQAAPA